MSNEGNAAYNAFLASLLMEYTHDQIADNLQASTMLLGVVLTSL